MIFWTTLENIQNWQTYCFFFILEKREHPLTSLAVNEIAHHGAIAAKEVAEAAKEAFDAFAPWKWGRRRRDGELTYEELLNLMYLREDEQNLAGKRFGDKQRTLAEMRLRMDVLEALMNSQGDEKRAKYSKKIKILRLFKLCCVFFFVIDLIIFPRPMIAICILI